jgi:hypothetical protein
MDGGTATVLAAVITGVFALINILLKFRSENRDDHAIVVGSLNRLTSAVERVEEKVDDHITDHARGMM